MTRRPARLSLSVILMIFAGFAPLRAQNHCAATANHTPGDPVGQWQRWEQTLISSNDYVGSNSTGNPYRDLLIRVTFTNCSSGASIQSYGFWFGFEKTASGSLEENPKAFLIRAALPAGLWQWETSCSKSPSAASSVPNCTSSADAGLTKKGRFQVTTGATNALYRRGFLDRSNDGRFLTYGRPAAGTEGTPFFWLGDAAWNAPILATLTDWKTYINNRATDSSNRANTAFTVVQLAVSPKIAGPVVPAATRRLTTPTPAVAPRTQNRPTNARVGTPATGPASTTRSSTPTRKVFSFCSPASSNPCRKSWTPLLPMMPRRSSIPQG